MPGILHIHLWGADNSSLTLLKMPLDPLFLAGVSRHSWGWEVLVSLIPMVENFGAGGEAASDVLRYPIDWQVRWLNCKPPARVVRSLKDISLARGGKMGCEWV